MWIVGGTLRVLRAETWLTVYRTIAIRKQVDKKNKKEPTINDTTFENFVELTRFCSITLIKVHRKSCRAYIEDQPGCVKT